MKGKVKFYNVSKGFGFIIGDDGNEYFVHMSALGDGVRLNENDEVTFEVEQGDRGPKAVKVKKGAAGASRKQERDDSEDSEESADEESDSDDFEEDEDDSDEE